MKFSIITCTYNSERYLQKNIDSLKNQSFQDFEHIFIDGFSTDKTVEVIREYQKEFPGKVKFFQFEPKGIGDAMNRGIEKSSGEYINHLHSDDSFYNNKVLEKVANFIKKKGHPDWIYGKAEFSDGNMGRIIPHRNIYKKARYWLLLVTNYIPHQSVFLKKEVFKKFGMFNEEYKNSMDYEMWIRLSKNNLSSIFLNEIICNFSVRNDSQSSSGMNICSDENKEIRKIYIKTKLVSAIINKISRLSERRKFF
jgi:glycosyltransferase involved in cell wall biosynthesis